MSNAERIEMPCEADWAETAIDADAVVPRHDASEAQNNVHDAEMLDEDDADEVLCRCVCCEGAVLEFYPDYLSFIKRMSQSEVNRRTMSQHRTMPWGITSFKVSSTRYGVRQTR
jgi:hypothetical protein